MVIHDLDDSGVPQCRTPTLRMGEFGANRGSAAQVMWHGFLATTTFSPAVPRLLQPWQLQGANTCQCERLDFPAWLHFSSISSAKKLQLTSKLSHDMVLDLEHLAIFIDFHWLMPSSLQHRYGKPLRGFQCPKFRWVVPGESGTDSPLVGGDWNHGFFWFSTYLGNFIIPTDEVHDFSEGWNYTTNQ